MRRGPSPSFQVMVREALGHHQAGRLAEAEQVYRQILAADPCHADALHLLGMIEYQAGRLEAAADLIRKAITIHGNGASYYSNLGTVLQAQGKLEEAEALYKRALALKPQLAEVHVNLANVLQAQGKLDESVISYERALALKPDSAETFNNLGTARQAQGQMDAAIACYERALAIKPDYAEVFYNLGNACRFQGKLDEAIAYYQRAIAIKSEYPEAYYNRGNVLREQGKVDEALVQFARALELRPEYAQAGFAESLAQLVNGDFAAGWKNFEKRWLTADHDTPRRDYAQPLWNGEKLASGSLLIWGEQGIGDEIMFAGLIPDLIRTGNRCVLDCQERLKPLFARSFPSIEVVSGCGPGLHPELGIVAQMPCGSLGGVFRNTSADFAATTSPFLFADPAERDRLRVGYADGRRLVGLAWYTNNRKWGSQRSVDLSLLASLFNGADTRWISLQYGDHDWLESQVAGTDAPILIDSSVDQLADIDLFAAQVAAMDLVITIDNSTAHLAGALGVPVWVLVPFMPDWRWLLDREDSPWYPAMRLFRQPKTGDWQSVVEKVRHALAVDFMSVESA